MRGRPKNFNPEEALNKAMDLFWDRGFEATSIQDLVDNVGINRASMYDTFGDKRAFFCAAVELPKAQVKEYRQDQDSRYRWNPGRRKGKRTESHNAD